MIRSQTPMVTSSFTEQMYWQLSMLRDTATCKAPADEIINTIKVRAIQMWHMSEAIHALRPAVCNLSSGPPLQHTL